MSTKEIVSNISKINRANTFHIDDLIEIIPEKEQENLENLKFDIEKSTIGVIAINIIPNDDKFKIIFYNNIVCNNLF